MSGSRLERLSGSTAGDKREISFLPTRSLGSKPRLSDNRLASPLPRAHSSSVPDEQGESTDLDEISEDEFEFQEKNRPKGGYFERSKEPDGWAMNGKVIRKDYVHTATRLILFRVMCRILPSIIRGQANSLKVSLATMGAKFLLWLTVKEAARDVAKWVIAVITIFINAEAEKSLEKLIRGECLVVQRQLFRLALEKHRKRGRRTVATRH